MKRIEPVLSISIILLIAIVFSTICFAAQEKRIALVLGNAKYKYNPLANPVNDANDISAALEKCGFKVIKTINASRKKMRKSIRRFGDEIAHEDTVGLFYYSGHAIQVEGENYIIPIGANIYAEDEVEDESLKVSAILRKMKTAGNRLNIIILDACRDNPFARSFRSSYRGLAKMDAPVGSIYAFSTSPGSVAADGSGRNGLYTSVLLKHILTPGLEIGQLFRRVRIEVMAISNNKQIPWESSSLIGSFYFNPARSIAVVDPAPATNVQDSESKSNQKRIQMIPIPSF